MRMRVQHPTAVIILSIAKTFSILFIPHVFICSSCAVFKLMVYFQYSEPNYSSAPIWRTLNSTVPTSWWLKRYDTWCSAGNGKFKHEAECQSRSMQLVAVRAEGGICTRKHSLESVCGLSIRAYCGSMAASAGRGRGPM